LAQFYNFGLFSSRIAELPVNLLLGNQIFINAGAALTELILLE